MEFMHSCFDRNWIMIMLFNRGAGGYWRTYQAQQLATPESFQANPSLVWEFYSYRREVMHSKVVHTHSHTLSCKSVLPVRRATHI